jgi:hypothetical protein
MLYHAFEEKGGEVKQGRYPGSAVEFVVHVVVAHVHAVEHEPRVRHCEPRPPETVRREMHTPALEGGGQEAVARA